MKKRCSQICNSNKSKIITYFCKTNRWVFNGDMGTFYIKKLIVLFIGCLWCEF
jgi:hypothetical protein